MVQIRTMLHGEQVRDRLENNRQEEGEVKESRESREQEKG
jgi:hypothetical protein